VEEAFGFSAICMACEWETTDCSVELFHHTAHMSGVLQQGDLSDAANKFFRILSYDVQKNNTSELAVSPIRMPADRLHASLNNACFEPWIMFYQDTDSPHVLI
jgi:hypothetical protein